MQGIRRIMVQTVGRRKFGSSHDHHHHEHEAPRFLGLAPNRQKESFELPTKLFLMSILVLAGLHVLAPETRLTEWAKDEIEERERRKEAGEEIEFGKNYFQERIHKDLIASVKKKN
jgi:hypothetical protein